MVEIDKFIVDFLNIELVRATDYDAPLNLSKRIIMKILKNQGIIYKEGQLQRLDGSCESGKDENIPYSPELTEFEEKLGSIIFNTWDIMKDCEECKGDVDYIKEKADELLGITSRNSKAKEEGYSSLEDSVWPKEDVEEVLRETAENTEKVLYAFRKHPLVKAEYERGYKDGKKANNSKPEVDIDEMVEEFVSLTDQLVSSHTRSLMEDAYRKGIVDTLNKLNIKKG